MTHPPITERSFELLYELARNNEKAWFHAHRSEFEVEVKDAFAGVLERCSRVIVDTALPYRGGKSTMFRTYRDVRFSKDKSPYATHVSGLMTHAGEKREDAGLIYLHMKPDAGYIAAGHYGLGAKQLTPIRRRMIEEPKRWERALDDLNDHGLTLSMDNSLKSMPRGFSNHAGHPLADYLRLKSLIAREDIADAEWIDGSVVARVRNLAEAAGKLVAFRI